MTTSDYSSDGRAIETSVSNVTQPPSPLSIHLSAAPRFLFCFVRRGSEAEPLGGNSSRSARRVIWGGAAGAPQETIHHCATMAAFHTTPSSPLEPRPGRRRVMEREIYIPDTMDSLLLLLGSNNKNNTPPLSSVNRLDNNFQPLTSSGSIFP